MRERERERGGGASARASQGGGTGQSTRGRRPEANLYSCAEAGTEPLLVGPVWSPGVVRRFCLMATSCQLYKKSTFPPLLDCYLPVICRNQNDSNQERISTDIKERLSSKKQDLSDEDKDELIRQAIQEQHHLETYMNMYKLRNILCEQYRTLLNEKVKKQRIQIKMSDLKFEQHLKHKAKKLCFPAMKEKKSLTFPPHLHFKKQVSSHKVPFCKLSHDTKYLESIPQSSVYLIIGLQNELTKLGIFKKQQDYEDFWKLMQGGIHGSKLQEKLPDIKAKC